MRALWRHIKNVKNKIVRILVRSPLSTLLSWHSACSQGSLPHTQPPRVACSGFLDQRTGTDSQTPNTTQSIDDMNKPPNRSSPHVHSHNLRLKAPLTHESRSPFIRLSAVQLQRSFLELYSHIRLCTGYG